MEKDNERNIFIIPYEAEQYDPLAVDQITGKTANIVSLAFGSYVQSVWLGDTWTVDSFESSHTNLVHSFAVPGDIFINKIIAMIRVESGYDLKDSIYRAKIRLYRSDIDKNIYTYIKGTQVDFMPEIRGVLDEKDVFIAEANDLEILVEKNSKLVLGVFVEVENIQDEYYIWAKAMGALSVSMHEL